MPDRVVLDSSVIAALFFPEEITEKAIGIAEDSECSTVDFACAEVGNVAWKRVVHGGFGIEDVRMQYDDALRFITGTCEVIPMNTLLLPAFGIACRTPVTLYDALFLAASDLADAPFVTSDRKLVAAVGNTRRVLLVH